jgi:hypothetical protein
VVLQYYSTILCGVLYQFVVATVVYVRVRATAPRRGVRCTMYGHEDRYSRKRAESHGTKGG